MQRADCIKRFKCFTDVSYVVELGVPKGDWYTGRVQYEFKVIEKPTGQDLFFDFRGVKIGKYVINGQDALAGGQNLFNNHHVAIPTALLKVGEVNKISMFILNKYRSDGCGFHNFIDQEDKRQYLYTQFEPGHAHWFFPLFDQPDLKATWQLSVKVDGDWTAISNEAEVEDAGKVQALDQAVDEAKAVFGDEAVKFNEPKTFIFNTSFKISTYLYAFVAGPFGYHEKITEGMPPMRIYARQSLVADVDHERMFMVTQCGIEFYEVFFGRKYPFRKYDQVFVPEHNYGAMENVGCVTYNENYIYRGETPTLAKRLRFSITNLHELAHMWFGNLVTMKWWNDLWLNESFATFMSFLVMSKSAKLQEYHGTCWVTFNQYKFWGISTDQLSSTHSICTECNDTDEAESMFDGISYGKGSAFLKQFFNIIGYEVMSKGLHAYFEKHAWGNTTLPDFVGCMAEAYKQSGDKSLGADFDLAEWCDTWLNTSGINVLEPILDV